MSDQSGLMMPEFVLCIPGRTSVPEGLTPLDGPDDLGRYFDPARMVLVPRSVDETDPEGAAFKQLVAYVVLVRGPHVFLHRRIPGTGEPDLAGRRSVGLGGHVNATDVVELTGGLGDVLYWAAFRETSEEVMNQVKGSPVGLTDPLALLYDPSNSVGRRHVGIVFRGEVSVDRDVRLRPGLEPLGWQTPAEVLGGDGPPLETWSMIVLGRPEVLGLEGE
jgi:predicted NUDIX family phosphoesterase